MLKTTTNSRNTEDDMLITALNNVVEIAMNRFMADPHKMVEPYKV